MFELLYENISKFKMQRGFNLLFSNKIISDLSYHLIIT